VDNEEKIDAKLGAGRAMGGVAQVFATIESPGVIRHHSAGRIIFGEMDGTVSARAETLRDAFARAEVPVELSKTIRRALWEKYLLICAVGGTTAVTRETIGAVRTRRPPGACSERSWRKSRQSRRPPAWIWPTMRSTRS
jgi:2-dehydropantoate 2-reductase